MTTHNVDIQENTARSPVRELASNKILGSIVTAFVIILIIIQTINLGRVTGSFEQMYHGLGTELSSYSLTNLVLSVPVWLYWILSLSCCAGLVLKDRYINNQMTKFLVNFLAFLALILLTAVFQYAITIPLHDLMQIIQ